MTDTELRELDAEIAEKVMAEWVAEQEVGKHVPPSSIIIHINGRSYFHPTKSPHMEGWSGLWRLPYYSTDIAAAMNVVEKMWQSGWQVEMVDCYKQGTLVVDNVCSWWVRFISNNNDMNNWSAHADSLPEAICKAALKAIESDAALTSTKSNE